MEVRKGVWERWKGGGMRVRADRLDKKRTREHHQENSTNRPRPLTFLSQRHGPRGRSAGAAELVRPDARQARRGEDGPVHVRLSAG